jgi:hypothetical protein
MSGRSIKPVLRLDWCTVEAAKFACENWHYSKTLPAQKLVRVGVWEDGKFIGCVLFGDGANNQMLKPYGLEYEDGCELVRIALTAHRTEVSRIMAVAMKFLRKHCPRLRLIVSYADPAQGHHGGVYQASGWVYTGSTAPSKVISSKGKLWHSQAIDCQRHRGHPDPCSSTLEWFQKYRDPAAKRVIVPGKHRYLMPLDEEIRKRIAPLAKPYPKRSCVRSADSGTTPQE